MAKPRVSVVIPTYNRQHLVIEAIESVLAQTCTDFEVIVIDDGSSDGTAARVAPYLDRITYRKQTNQGVAAARNSGIRLAQGEFLCFLDSDDLWLPKKLETQLQFAEAHPEYALLSSELQGFDADHRPMGKGKAAMYDIHNGHAADHLLFDNWIQTSTVMLRRNCLDEVGWFDEDVGQFGEDWLLWMRVASRFPIYFLPEPLVSYRFHPGRLTLYQPEEQFNSLMRCLGKISTFPEFQQKQHLLRKAEYEICLGRAKSNLSAGNYDLAKGKLERAYRLRTIPIVPVCLLLRTTIEQKIRRNRSSSAEGRAN